MDMPTAPADISTDYFTIQPGHGDASGLILQRFE